MSRHPVLESCWMLVAALSFSLMAGCMKVAADTFSIYEIIFYRSLLGVVIGYGVLRKTGITLHTTRPWTYVFRCSVGTFCILLGVWIVWRLPLGTAQTLAYTAALFFALFCKNLALRIFYGKERKPCCGGGFAKRRALFCGESRSKNVGRQSAFSHGKQRACNNSYHII